MCSPHSYSASLLTFLHPSLTILHVFSLKITRKKYWYQRTMDKTTFYFCLESMVLRTDPFTTRGLEQLKWSLRYILNVTRDDTGDFPNNLNIGTWEYAYKVIYKLKQKLIRFHVSGIQLDFLKINKIIKIMN